MENIPIDNIDVTTLSEETYDELMDGITARYAARSGDNTYMGIPITTNAEGWFIISLNVPGSPSVQLLINLKNGYLTAIRNGQGRWYYLDGAEEPPQHLNATMIKHLKASYTSLVKKNNWAEVAVGPISALEAYHALVNFNNQLPKNHPRVDIQRRALARLAVMFCEGARLRTVRELVSQQMGLGTNTVIDPSTKEKITSWSVIRKFALYCRRRQQHQQAIDAREMAKLAKYQIFTMDQVLGDPNGELFLILDS